jgi:large subunit ribosomal protein L9
MKVILKESYMNLGEAGDVVDVRPGYARNFLLPEKIAVTATKANIQFFQDKAKELEAKKLKERDNAKRIVESLEKVSITLKRKVSDDGKLFGSVTTKELESEFARLGTPVDRRQIVLGAQIKMAGDYSILIKLVGGLRAHVPLKILSDAPPKAKDEELEKQLAEAEEIIKNEKAAAKNAEKAPKAAATETPEA